MQHQLPAPAAAHLRNLKRGPWESYFLRKIGAKPRGATIADFLDKLLLDPESWSTLAFAILAMHECVRTCHLPLAHAHRIASLLHLGAPVVQTCTTIATGDRCGFALAHPRPTHSNETPTRCTLYFALGVRLAAQSRRRRDLRHPPQTALALASLSADSDVIRAYSPRITRTPQRQHRSLIFPLPLSTLLIRTILPLLLFVLSPSVTPRHGRQASRPAWQPFLHDPFSLLLAPINHSVSAWLPRGGRHAGAVSGVSFRQPMTQ